MDGAEVRHDAVEACKVCELYLDLEQGAVDEEGNQVGELVRVEHLGHLDVCLGESSKGLAAFLDVTNFEKQGQLLALTHIVGADLGVETPQEILTFGQLKFYRIPIVHIEELLKFCKGIEKDAT